MKFRYRRYAVEPSPAAPNLYVISRPVIPVRFSGPKEARNCYALLDTGADESYITESLAEKLGMAPIPEALGTIQSASGQMSIWYGSGTIEVSDGAERFFAPITLGVVSETWSEAVLGHIGFLDQFDAAFSYADQTVTLIQRPSQ